MFWSLVQSLCVGYVFFRVAVYLRNLFTHPLGQAPSARLDLFSASSGTFGNSQEASGAVRLADSALLKRQQAGELLSSQRGLAYERPAVPPSFVDTVVIGAGPAGLATSGQLTIDGQSHLVLERACNAGDSWAHHYKRLCLHSHRAVSELPGLPFPAHWPAFVPREQVVDYLRGYAITMHLPIYFGYEVLSCEPFDEQHHHHHHHHHHHQQQQSDQMSSGTSGGGKNVSRWVVRTREVVTGQERSIHCANLVLCVGENAQPFRPHIEGLDQFTGTVLHSHEYDVGSPFTDKRVLVVGFGNSGGEILIDLCEHRARPDVVVRSPCNIFPRDMFLPFIPLMPILRYLPAKILDTINAPTLRSKIGDLRQFGIECPHPKYGPIECLERQHRPPVVDIGQVALIRDGTVTVRPVIQQVNGSEVTFRDGTTAEYDAIILATGFRDCLDSLLPAEVCTAIRDPDSGMLWCCGKRIDALPGLYFNGYSDKLGRIWQMTLHADRISRMIRGEA